MIKVGFLGLKGGTGKTMLATQVVVHACEYFNIPSLVDLDPTSGGASLWAKARQDSSNLGCPNFLAGASDPDDAVERAELTGVDFLCMDGAPAATDQTRVAAALCDAVVLPLKPCDDDLERVGLAARLIADAGCSNLIFAVNDVPLASSKQTYLINLAKKFKRDFEEAGYPAVIIHTRELYTRTRNDGLAVGELRGPGPRGAKREIAELFETIIRPLGLRVESVGK